MSSNPISSKDLSDFLERDFVGFFFSCSCLFVKCSSRNQDIFAAPIAGAEHCIFHLHCHQDRQKRQQVPAAVLVALVS